MATYRQCGESSAKNGLPAERAVLEFFRADMPLDELQAGVSQFLDGYGVKSNPARATLLERCVRSVSKRGGARDSRRGQVGQVGKRRAVAGKKRAAGGRSNPASAAADGYREFHGHDAEVTTAVSRRVHFHRYLSGAGVLKGLLVHGIDGQDHDIKRFKKALLAFNEAKNQLFIEGGDQSVNLADFGITEPHELETLGKVISIDYHTNKSHLGAEGGSAVYRHGFRMTNQNGKHVVVEITRYPDLIYRVLEEQLEFSGGSYLIRREGIDF